MYLALYRKYRPLFFTDVVGQPAIVEALKNQIAAGRVGHAYLFCGTRGTGKTSCAKIFAKAACCEDPKDGDACGDCTSCRTMQNGQNFDMQEIDAASNNGVDFIRELREETAFTPANSKFKVYIIDEVHMLSTAAFNALLKIMEEPPSHVIFLLATTEGHKVPATILSRCQRYDFRRIPPKIIESSLLKVAKAEKIELEPEAAALISLLADGAMRDALSLLDTISSGGGTVTTQRVTQLAGLADRNYLFALSDMLETGDLEGIAKKLTELHGGTLDEKQLLKELMTHYKNLLLAAVDTSLLAALPPEDIEQYSQRRGNATTERLLFVADMLNKALDRISSVGNAEAEILLCLMRIAQNSRQTVQSPQVSATEKISAVPVVKESVKPILREEPKPLKQTALPITDGEFLQWGEVVDRLKDVNPLAYVSLLSTKAYIKKNYVLIDGSEVFIEFMRRDKTANAVIRNAISEVIGINYHIGPYAQEKTDNKDGKDTIKQLEELGVPIEYK